MEISLDDFTSGAPKGGGSFWLQLKPTEKLKAKAKRLDYFRYCFVKQCPCHNEFIGMPEKDKAHMDSGLVEVSGFIRLPE